MRNRFSLSVLIVLFASACQKNEECVPPPLAKHLVNKWNAQLVSEKDKSQELIFENNGIFKESKGFIFGAASSPICSWEVNNGAVILNGKFSSGSAEQYQCTVISRTCDKIILDIEGVDQLELNK